jgi:hypothetical protein
LAAATIGCAVPAMVLAPIACAAPATAPAPHGSKSTHSTAPAPKEFESGTDPLVPDNVGADPAVPDFPGMGRPF